MKKNQIKVAQFICSTGFYGAEKWILALADNTDRNTVEHTLIVSREHGSSELELFRQFKDLKLPAVEVQMKHKFDIQVVKKLCEYIKEQQIDIIHTHGYKSDLLGLWAAKRAGIACITTPHGFENTKDFKLRLFIALGCQSFRYFDIVAPLSEALESDVQKFGVKPEKIKLITNAVNLKDSLTTSGDADLNLSTSSIDNENEFVIGYVGQLISRKNISELLLAFAEVHKNYSNTRLLLVGDGEQRNMLEDKTASLGLSDVVTFTGFVSNTAKYFRKMNLFAMTSSLEGIPRSMMEAMSFGVPVVAYDIPGVDLLVSDEKTGLLVPKNDTSKLQAALERCISEVDYAAVLAKNATELIRESYSAGRMAEQYNEAYSMLIEPN